MLIRYSTELLWSHAGKMPERQVKRTRERKEKRKKGTTMRETNSTVLVWNVCDELRCDGMFANVMVVS